MKRQLKSEYKRENGERSERHLALQAGRYDDIICGAGGVHGFHPLLPDDNQRRVTCFHLPQPPGKI